MDPCIGAPPDTPASAPQHGDTHTAKNRKGEKTEQNAKAEAQFVIFTLIHEKKIHISALYEALLL